MAPDHANEEWTRRSAARNQPYEQADGLVASQMRGLMEDYQALANAYAIMRVQMPGRMQS
jgi:hypothetical protein